MFKTKITAKLDELMEIDGNRKKSLPRIFFLKTIFSIQFFQNVFFQIFFGLFSYQSMVLQLASAKKLEKNARCVIRISDVGYLSSDSKNSHFNSTHFYDNK
jgi:hypothetical protein